MHNGHVGVVSHQNHLGKFYRQPRISLVTLALFCVFAANLFIDYAAAGETNLLLNGKAIHLNTPAGKNLNEKNWGLGIQYDGDMVSKKWYPFATASGFKDSNENLSYYAGGGALRRFQGEKLHFDIGAIGFLMTRKDFKHDKPFLGVLPAFSVGGERFSVNMTYIPKVEPKSVALVFFQLKIRL
jgi:hypothetical protein